MPLLEAALGRSGPQPPACIKGLTPKTLRQDASPHRGQEARDDDSHPRRPHAAPGGKQSHHPRNGRRTQQEAEQVRGAG